VLVVPRRQPALSPSPRKSHVGPFRLDPFRSYPIPATESVQMAVDFCKHSLPRPLPQRLIGPPVIQDWAPQWPSVGDVGQPYDNQLIELLFPFALRHAVLFQMLVAEARVGWLVSLQQAPLSDRPFLHHRGKALSMLRERLANQTTALDDVTALTIGSALVIDVSPLVPRSERGN